MKNAMNESSKKHQVFWLCLLLTLATAVVYWQVRDFQFLDYDDNTYITENPNVSGGLSGKSVMWAFAALHADTSYWHPLTWLSHMLDCSLYGLKPGMHHLTNLFFHIVNTLLLFWVFKKMTNAVGPSAFVAAAFAFHPLHVESVAWVAERKDLLSAFFWLLTMWAYVRYTERPGIGRYLPVLLIFSLALMSKPMVVTLPFAMLLLDYWPLERFQTLKAKQLWRLVAEKIPLFILAITLSVVAIVAQKSAGAMAPKGILSFGARMSNALVSYTSYISKTIWPTRLAVLYPHPGNTLPIWQVLISFLILAIVTIAIIRRAKRQRYLIVGWFWFLGTLVPAIGLIQVGSQAMADRYTYLSLIGIFIMITWGAVEFTAKWRYQKLWLAIMGVTVSAVMLVCTHMQLRHWRNNFTLFAHAIEVTEGNFTMYENLGVAFYSAGNSEESIKYHNRALQIKPDYHTAHFNLAIILAEQKKYDDAAKHYKEALRIEPGLFIAHHNLGVMFKEQGKINEAIEQWEEIFRMKPDHVPAYLNIALTLMEYGRYTEAIDYFHRVLQLAPTDVRAIEGLKIATTMQNR